MNTISYDVWLTLKFLCLSNKRPQLEIFLNGNSIAISNVDCDSSVKILLKSPFGPNNLEIKFLNKEPFDTIIDNEGNIVADLAIHVLKFEIENHDLTQHMISNCKYITSTDETMQTYGYMSHNGTLSYQYICPGFYFIRQIS